MRQLLLTSLFLIALTSSAQITPGQISFALPDHPGRLSLSQGAFKITELSAKPNNNEFGVRGENGDLNFLGFMFVWPEHSHLTAETCREEMLKREGAHSLAAVQGRAIIKSSSGVEIATALMVPEDGQSSAVRAFVAAGDLCSDLLFSLHQPITKQMVPMQAIKDLLNSVRFDPSAKPTFREAFAYATVEWDKQQIAGAARAYRSALALVEDSDDPLKWRRVTTDQLSMALGMSGDLKGSIEVNEAAIRRDPKYPLYYYDLACADAEAGNAAQAREHLKQAFERKANTLPGEHLPDPSKDDSIQKLKSNKDFWAYVQTLH